MAEASVPVDLFNPGQVFACLGLLEVSDVLLGQARGGFEWPAAGGSGGDGTHFHVAALGGADPVREVLGFLARAEVRSVAPAGGHGERLSTDKWSVPTESLRDGDPFPCPAPQSPATLPAVLRDGDHEVVLDHWGDGTVRDNVKFWAGAGGYPGVSLLLDALRLVGNRLDESYADPFSVAAPQTSSFRFDWRRDYVPLGIGFSLNEHARIQPRGYPWVEILAAIGLGNARPQRPERRNKLGYRYAVLGGRDIPLVLHRAALGCTRLPFPRRTFRMTLEWPGQENQARCITDVVEETDA